jgi:hypothetical protein
MEGFCERGNEQCLLLTKLMDSKDITLYRAMNSTVDKSSEQ